MPERIQPARAKQMGRTALAYALLGMAGGVFYREFTKFNGVAGGTALSKLHGHLFMLGMFFFLVLLLLDAQYAWSGDKRYAAFYIVYNTGLGITAAAFLCRGVLEVLQTELSRGADASISGVAGIGHILLAVGMVLFFLMLLRRLTGKERAGRSKSNASAH